MILRALFFGNNEELGKKGIFGQPPSRDRRKWDTGLFKTSGGFIDNWSGKRKTASIPRCYYCCERQRG